MSSLLELDGIETAYGSSQVLFGVSLAVHAGEFVAVRVERPEIAGEAGAPALPDHLFRVAPAGHEDAARRQQAPAARLVFGMDARGRYAAEHAADPLARGEQVGDQRRVQALHLLEHQRRMPALRGQGPDHGGDVLVAPHRLAHRQQVLREVLAVGRDETVQVLPGVGQRVGARHGQSVA